ncbi:MAG: VOC family protein [Cyanobacteria bacterium J06641_5]
MARPITPSIFHLAIPATDLAQSKQFYCQCLGCNPGRETDRALILDFYGHQLVLHVSHEPVLPQRGIYPRHFGLVFPGVERWEAFIAGIRERQLEFHIAPRLRFPGQLTEHWSCFLADPSANLLEFKYYCHAEAIFGARDCPQVGDRSLSHPS